MQWAQTFQTGGTLQIGPARLYLNYADLTVTGTTPSAPRRRDKIPGGGLVWEVTPSFQVTAAFFDDIASDLGNVQSASGHKISYSRGPTSGPELPGANFVMEFRRAEYGE